ncbi:MAG TPA: primosomal protein N' [Chromatiales bacterium]|nr:primosomal protein N' [Chromatiales bacterium]
MARKRLIARREPVLAVAVPAAGGQVLDYLPPRGAGPPPVGARVRVRVRGRLGTGIVVARRRTSAVPEARLRRVAAVLEGPPALTPELAGLVRWAAAYYRCPEGAAFVAALPGPLWRARAPLPEGVWRPTAAGREADLEALRRRAPRQAEALAELRRRGAMAAAAAAARGWRRTLEALARRGWARLEAAAPAPAPPPAPRGVALTDEQRRAAGAVAAALGRFEAFVLEGVTGSGKTEVYLAAVEAAVAAGGQALVLVPEIALAPQLLARCRERFGADRVALLHSALPAAERLAAWEAARSGRACVVVGTRSAVFAPLARPALVVVDEEHDPAYREGSGPLRHSARDLAVVRARRAGVPVVLGSATPSLETVRNAREGRYRPLALRQRPRGAARRRVELVDIRGRPLDGGMSPPLLARIGAHLRAGGQVLLFRNRRGYAPALLCDACGWAAGCPRCEARLVWHRAAAEVRCHHCGHRAPVPERCPECGDPELRARGHGTERVEAALAGRFPGVPLVRLDRDATRARGALERALEAARAGTARILVGTQMIAKGHDFPEVTLVGVLDADQGLFSADFRGPERMAQLIVQVMGRAGRRGQPAEVLVQTRQPGHPLLRALLAGGYGAFAEAALAERRAAGLPPYGALALLRAEAPSAGAAERFLEAARGLLAPPPDGVEVLGPAPAPMERRAGLHRWQLLVQAPSRRARDAALDRLAPRLDALPEARRVRWALEVDPAALL